MGAGKDPPSDPSLMRDLGAFFGHVIAAIREDPGVAPAEPRREEVDAAPVKARIESQEVRQGEFVLRRTTIDEVIHDPVRADDADTGRTSPQKSDEANRPCQ